MTVEERMKEAIKVAAEGHTPYGCMIYNNANHKYIVAANQTKVKGKTAHAEMEALRLLNEYKWNIKELTLYTTAEPCPMCMAAILWCGISDVVYGVPIDKIMKYHKQIDISAAHIAEESWINCQITPRYMEDECLDLFEKYS